MNNDGGVVVILIGLFILGGLIGILVGSNADKSWKIGTSAVVHLGNFATDTKITLKERDVEIRRFTPTTIRFASEHDTVIVVVR